MRTRIQLRAERHVAEVTLFKPDPVSAALHPLAPLILVETNDEGPASSFPMEVYSWTDVARFRGESLAQIAFVWEQTGRGAAGFQGVRLTLDDRGQPILWEVLWDRSGVRLVYASESLEEEAKTRFGAPLPGRRYHLEPQASGNHVIARVLDDAGVPMGPMLYVEADTGDVSTVICRCMPAQADEVRATVTYTLLMVNPADWGGLPRELSRAARAWSPARPMEDLTHLVRVQSD